MKKYTLNFQAIPFTGDFAAIDSAANAAHPGSGASFAETVNESGKSLSFTDANGNSSNLNVGDSLRECFDSNGNFIGYMKVAEWVNAAAVEVVDTPPVAAAPTAQATA
jgi:hypothetical protein